jgi:hypothetical protein
MTAPPVMPLTFLYVSTHGRAHIVRTCVFAQVVQISPATFAVGPHLHLDKAFSCTLEFSCALENYIGPHTCTILCSRQCLRGIKQCLRGIKESCGECPTVDPYKEQTNVCGDSFGVYSAGIKTTSRFFTLLISG